MKIRQIRYLLLALTISATLASCKARKRKTAMVETPPQGEVEIKILCSGLEFFSDNKHFRANAIGESMDQEVRKKARSNAKADLAASVNTTIKSVVDNYFNSVEVNNVEQVSEKFEGLTREVVDQELSGVVTICERNVKTQSGAFKTYVALELDADKLVDSINQRLTKEQELKTNYDYMKFKETFDKEMEKMSK